MLALSAHVVVNGDYRNTAAAGFGAYLTKPVEAKAVLREIQRTLGC